MEGTLASGIGTEASFKWVRFTVEMSLLWEAAASLSYGLRVPQNVKLQGSLEINQEHSWDHPVLAQVHVLPLPPLSTNVYLKHGGH